MPSVLVIDDSRFAALQIEKILLPRKIDVYHAENAGQVFGFKGEPSLLREHTPDIIILDLLMPDMHGFDILTKLQSMVKIKDIPVMIFSATQTESHAVESLHRGAKSFLAKPLDEDKFLTELASIAKETNLRDMMQMLAEYLSTGVRATHHRDDLKVGQANLSYMLEILDDDEEMLRELVQVYVEDSPRQLERVAQAIDEENADGLRHAAHLFKGSVSNFGAALITETALELEVMGRNNQLDGARDIFETLKTDAEELHKEMLAWLAF